MASLKKSIVIKAPADRIFRFMNEPENLPGIWPSMIEVKDVHILDNGGASFHFVYSIAGIRLESYSEDTEFVLNQRTVSKSSGGVESKVTLVYTPVSNGTEVTLESEYKIPVPVIGKLAEGVMVKMTEQETEVLLANLKTRMEEV
jgi:uncharacterized membrane protein